MSNDQRLLWCLIDTDIDIESMPFEVTAPINASVNRLKELVWEKGKNGVLGNVDAENLVLYKLHKPLLIEPVDDLKNKLGTKPAQYAAKMAEPTYKVSAYFSDEPPEGHLSIVVQVPSADDSLPRKRRHVSHEPSSNFTLLDHQAREKAVADALSALAPSEVAANSKLLNENQQEHPIFNGIPFHRTGPPIVIFEKAFAIARDKLAQISPDDDSETSVQPERKALVADLIVKSTAIYRVEEERETAVYNILSKLLGVDFRFQVPVHHDQRLVARSDALAEADVPFLQAKAIHGHAEVKNNLGSCGDATIQNPLSLRKLQALPSYADIREVSHCPCLHVSVMGCYISFAGSVFVDCFSTQILTDLIYLGGDPYISSRVLYVTKIFDIFREVMRSLAIHYAGLLRIPQDHSIPLPQPTYNSPLPLLSSLRFLSRYQFPGWSPELFGYRRSLYKAQLTDSHEIVLVKFCERYNEQAHSLLAEKGLAPRLHCCVKLKGGVKMVVMEFLEGWDPAAIAFLRQDLPPTVVDKLKTVIESLHELRLVFGDLRRPNVLVQKVETGSEGMDVYGEAAEWLVKMVDFEWAGREGEAQYPPIMNVQDITWAGGMGPCCPMKMEHDVRMLEIISAA